MSDGLAKRGAFLATEADATASATLAERLQSVLRRNQNRTGDAPVAVSAGFLRWVADASTESSSKSDLAELKSQIAKLTHERDEARASVIQTKAHSDRVSEQLQLADVRVASLTARVAKLREALAVMTGKPAVTNNK